MRNKKQSMVLVVQAQTASNKQLTRKIPTAPPGVKIMKQQPRSTIPVCSPGVQHQHQVLHQVLQHQYQPPRRFGQVSTHAKLLGLAFEVFCGSRKPGQGWVLWESDEPGMRTVHGWDVRG